MRAVQAVVCGRAAKHTAIVLAYFTHTGDQGKAQPRWDHTHTQSLRTRTHTLDGRERDKNSRDGLDCVCVYVCVQSDGDAGQKHARVLICAASNDKVGP